MAQSRQASAQLAQRRHGPVAVLHGGGGHQHGEQETLGIGDDMALAPLDPLGSVEAAWAAAFRRRRALAVDDAGRGGGVAPQCVTGLACQLGSDHLPSAVIAPSIEISLHGRAWRKVLRQDRKSTRLQSLMRISYAVFCLKNKNTHTKHTTDKQ